MNSQNRSNINRVLIKNGIPKFVLFSENWKLLKIESFTSAQKTTRESQLPP